MAAVYLGGILSSPPFWASLDSPAVECGLAILHVLQRKLTRNLLLQHFN